MRPIARLEGASAAEGDASMMAHSDAATPERRIFGNRSC
jgi:hypothetical protein